MTGLCLRCGRREREAGLLTCRECLERMLGKPEPPPKWEPAWKRNLKARDSTGAIFRDAA